MYLEFFKLRKLPFKLTADTEFHYLAEDRLRTKVQLSHAIDTVDGPIVLVGEPGVGKTALLEECIKQLEPYMRVAFVRHPEMSSDEFYEATVAQLLRQEPASKADGRASGRFEEAVTNLAAAGEQVLVAVDNAEIASQDLLEDILRLARRRRSAAARVSVVVSGRPELRQMFSGPRFNTDDRRPALEIHLSPLPPEQTRRYMEHRLAVAGLERSSIFTDDAYAEIQRFTGGVPQMINTLADASMTAAYGRNHAAISATDIRTVASQLRWVEFSARAVPSTTPAGSPQTMSAYITVEHRNRVVAEYVLNLGKVTLGRAQRNDIRIDSEFVSRDHCRILTSGTTSVIEDLQSQNGLLIGGQRVSVHRLHDGDVIQVGDHSITYRRGRPNRQLEPAPESGTGNAETVQTRVISQADSTDDKLKP